MVFFCHARWNKEKIRKCLRWRDHGYSRFRQSVPVLALLWVGRSIWCGLYCFPSLFIRWMMPHGWFCSCNIIVLFHVSTGSLVVSTLHVCMKHFWNIVACLASTFLPNVLYGSLNWFVLEYLTYLHHFVVIVLMFYGFTWDPGLHILS
jgi:hypothetical protein